MVTPKLASEPRIYNFGGGKNALLAQNVVMKEFLVNSGFGLGWEFIILGAPSNQRLGLDLGAPLSIASPFGTGASWPG